MVSLVPFLALLGPAICAAPAQSSGSGGQLNVLLIASDDLNRSVGCYGHPIVKSPNLDRLAARGVRFERAYCNYPVCNPSRASFLSGRRPDSTGVVDNVTPTRAVLKDAVMLPEHFRNHGYRTVKVGKNFHSMDEVEFSRSWDGDIREDATAKNPPKAQILKTCGERGIVLKANDEDTWDGFVARKAVELMEQAVSEPRPFSSPPDSVGPTPLTSPRRNTSPSMTPPN